MESQFEEAQVHSINVSGGLRKVEFAGQTVITGFFKTPVSGKVHAHQLGLEGDAQGDLRVHGGPDKAVYFYPQEHYQAWEELLGTGPLSPGSFGENITSRGLLETDLSVGDVIRIGTVVMQVLQPRSPCYKLQMKFDRPAHDRIVYAAESTRMVHLSPSGRDADDKRRDRDSLQSTRAHQHCRHLALQPEI